MKFLAKISASLAAAALLAAPAEATLFVCEGNVERVLNHYDGYLNLKVSGLGGSFSICNANVSYYGVQTEACRGYFTLVLTAFVTGKKLRLSFDTANSANTHMTTDCAPSNFGDNWRVPYAVEVLN